MLTHVTNCVCTFSCIFLLNRLYFMHIRLYFMHIRLCFMHIRLYILNIRLYFMPIHGTSDSRNTYTCTYTALNSFYRNCPL